MMYLLSFILNISNANPKWKWRVYLCSNQLFQTYNFFVISKVISKIQIVLGTEYLWFKLFNYHYKWVQKVCHPNCHSKLWHHQRRACFLYSVGSIFVWWAPNFLDMGTKTHCLPCFRGRHFPKLLPEFLWQSLQNRL